MRRFLVTSAKFKGHVELRYNDDGLVCLIDMQQSNMDTENTYHFKAAVPLTIKHIEAGTGFSKGTSVVEVDFVVSFDMFWNTYNVKINKKRCEILWSKMAKTQQVKAWHGIAGYDKFLQKNQWRSKADPETYLKNEMWDNEWR